jgi:hypothetical protein
MMDNDNNDELTSIIPSGHIRQPTDEATPSNDKSFLIAKDNPTASGK